MERQIVTLLAGLIASVLCAGGASASVTILPVYDGMSKYADAVVADPTADRRVLWQRHVIDPYWDRCAAGGEYIDFAPPLKTPYNDVESLRKAAAALESFSVQEIAKSAVEKSSAVLAGDTTTVCILAADSSWTYLRAMHGVGGFTAGAGKIWLTILPEADWSEWVAYATAHEYHHSVWTASYGKQNPIEDMTDYLVFEGRADAFAKVMYPKPRVPWTHALTPQQESAAWQVIRKNLKSTSADVMQKLMFGGSDGVSQWAGYTIGFNIVQSYVEKRHELTVNEWTALDAEELLRGSKYSAE